MEYAGSYALFNYRLEDPAKGLEYSNLRLIRAFEHGLDPSSSEAGFVLVHVDMVRNSGPLVDGVVSALDACAANDRQRFDAGMEKVVQSMTKVNQVMESKLTIYLLLRSSFSRRSYYMQYCTNNELQLCGESPSPETIPPSAPSSWASPPKVCFLMVWSTKVYRKNPSLSVENLAQMTA